ncbi:glycosyltransferase family 4 protein [Gammaproteobacteria bacterium]|nr:glycosyltransferase family 4 protein [Gammaproteobacteria bacterium]
MKIAHYVLSSTFAGIEQHVQELANIQSRENEIVVICNQSISHHYTNIKVQVVANISRRSIFGILSLILVLRNIRPDIVHSHGSKTTSIINSVRRLIKLRHVATVHGIKTKTKVYNKAHKVIAGSQKVQDTLRTESSIVENWWHPSLPQKINNRAEYVLAIGRLEPVKGFDLLIESWVNVNKKLLIVGDGPEFSKLNSLIDKHGLADCITITPSVSKEDLIEYYQKASLLIVSSRREGGPRVALEALYLHIPVISTNVGHMSQILPKELLAEPDNLESLKSIIHSWINRSMNQESIFEYIADEYSIDKASKKVLSVYEDLLSKS